MEKFICKYVEGVKVMAFLESFSCDRERINWQTNNW